MGGRGAASNSGKHVYGTEYRSVHTFGNVKFVVNTINPNAKTPMETQTKGRVYATLNPKTGKVQYISYYDAEGKKYKVLEYHTKTHYVMNSGKRKNLKTPHRHSGYKHNENGAGNLTKQERRLTANILSEWRRNVRKKTG